MTGPSYAVKVYDLTVQTLRRLMRRFSLSLAADAASAQALNGGLRASV